MGMVPFPRVVEAHGGQHPGRVAGFEIRHGLRHADDDTGMRLPGHAGENRSDGDSGTSTIVKRASNCSTRFPREARPVVGAGHHDRFQRAHHLAAVADAEREGVGAGEEGRERVRARLLKRMVRAQPWPAPSTSP